MMHNHPYLSLLVSIITLCCSISTYAQSSDAETLVPQKAFLDKKPILIQEEDMRWVPSEDLPPGAQVSLLQGDPTREGQYIFRLMLPANYKLPPNWMLKNVFVSVIRGSYNVGAGDTYDPTTTIALTRGGFMVLPADSKNYGFTAEDTILEFHGEGPRILKYVKASDDPRINPDIIK